MLHFGELDRTSETAEARVIKFCTPIGYIKLRQQSTPKGRGQGHVTHSKISGA